MPITTIIVSSNPVHGEVYSIQHYVIVCQWIATGMWFSLGTPVSSTNKTYRYDITEILLKLALNTLSPPPCKMKFTFLKEGEGEISWKTKQYCQTPSTQQNMKHAVSFVSHYTLWARKAHLHIPSQSCYLMKYFMFILQSSACCMLVDGPYITIFLYIYLWDDM